MRGVIAAKTRMPISVTRSRCVSISHKGIFFPTFLFWVSVFDDSSVLSSCLRVCSLVNSDLQASVRRSLSFFIISPCLLSSHTLRNVHRASRTLASTFRVWMALKRSPNINKNRSDGVFVCLLFIHFNLKNIHL